MGRLDWAGFSMIGKDCSTKKWSMILLDIRTLSLYWYVIVLFRLAEAVLPGNIGTASATMGENYAGRQTGIILYAERKTPSRLSRFVSFFAMGLKRLGLRKLQVWLPPEYAW